MTPRAQAAPSRARAAALPLPIGLLALVVAGSDGAWRSDRPHRASQSH
jgi:hypothetical protein